MTTDQHGATGLPMRVNPLHAQHKQLKAVASCENYMLDMDRVMGLTLMLAARTFLAQCDFSLNFYGVESGGEQEGVFQGYICSPPLFLFYS